MKTKVRVPITSFIWFNVYYWLMKNEKLSPLRLCLMLEWVNGKLFHIYEWHMIVTNYIMCNHVIILGVHEHAFTYENRQ